MEDEAEKWQICCDWNKEVKIARYEAFAWKKFSTINEKNDAASTRAISTYRHNVNCIFVHSSLNGKRIGFCWFPLFQTSWRSHA